MVGVMVVMVTSSQRTYASIQHLPEHEFEHTLGDAAGQGSLVC